MRSIRILLSRYFFLLNVSKRKWFLILCAFLFAALLELVGIGSIGLFIQAAVNTDPTEAPPQWMRFFPEFMIQDANSRILSFGLLAFGFLAFRMLVSNAIQFYIGCFNQLKTQEIQRKLFGSYLNSPLLFRKSSNIASHFHHIGYLPGKFTNFSNDLFSLASNLIMTLAVILLLGFASPIATLSISALFALTALLYFGIIRERSRFYAILQADAAKEQHKNVQESIGALEEIQILRKTPFFTQKFRSIQDVLFRYSMRSRLLGMIPRPLAEISLLSFIIGFSLIYSLYVGNIREISNIIGMFAIAGLRLVPATTVISFSMNGLKGSSFAIHRLFEEIQRIQNTPNLLDSKDQNAPYDPLDFESEIRGESISFTYPNTDTPAIHDLSFTIRKGSRCAIVGRSGSGKSTLINLLIGNMHPSSGNILVDGQPISECITRWRDTIFYLPQSLYLLDDTVARNICIGMEESEINWDRLNWCIEKAQLSELVDTLPKGVNTLIGDRGDRISGGQKQRVGIARALYFDRKVIILDEATSALDEETEFEVKQSILALGPDITVIMITHNLRSDDIFDQILKLQAPDPSLV